MRALAAFAIALSAFPAICAGPPKLASQTLANGMTLIVEEDHELPNVAMYLFYRIGSRNERPGITGISHFFKHMMFNGARKYGPKQFDIEIDSTSR